MPLLRNKFQPYFPDTDSPNNYNCGDEQYCHLIQLGDTTKSQFYQTPCGSNEIVDPTFSDYTLGAESLTNPNFTGSAVDWILGGNWVYGTDNIVHTLGSFTGAFQTTLALPFVAGFYQITIDITRTSGSVRVGMGLGGNATYTDYFSETGLYTVILYYNDVADQIIGIYPNTTDDFDGTVNSISVKEVTYNSWEPALSWELVDGLACHIPGTTGILEETVANYIDANEYYEITITSTGVVAGSVDVYIADALAATITVNGIDSYYATPTVAGVVSFDPSSDFVGCISAPDLRKLNNNHLAYLVDSDGNEYEIFEYFQYYERWVTLIFDISELELPYACYTIKVVDACIVSGNNLVTNGTFSAGSTGWALNNGASQYTFGGTDLELNFTPQQGSNYITNGDFATGDFTGWTAGANWSVVGNKAVHTAGSTATLVQSVVIPAPVVPPLSYSYFILFTISNRTAGSISITLGDKTVSGITANDTITKLLKPTTSGAVNFTITPTSDFDGEIDDIEVYYTNLILVSTPSLINAANTLMIAGNYEISFEITAQSDPLISVGVRILGQSGPIQYFSGVGTHTASVPSYVPGAQQLQVIGLFESGGYGIAGTVTVDNFEVYPVEPFDATYTSECLKYAESFPNSKMLVAYCDQPSFGFEFANTGFQFQQRAVVRSIEPNYPREGSIQRSGNGNARITYAGIEKFWQLHTAFASETFHDALAAMISCDHFLIGTGESNGTEYIAEVEDFQPDWIATGGYSLAPATIILRIKDNGQLFNRHI